MSEQETHPTPFQQASPSEPWWVRFCGGLWKVMTYLGTVVILGAVASLIATWLTSPNGVIPANTPLRHFLASWPIVLAVGGCLLLIALLIRILSRWPVPVGAPSLLSEQNRTRMLLRLQRTYADILAQSLQDVARIELGLAQRPDAVQNAATLLLRVPHRAEQLLPPGTPITQVYEEAAHELLILGEPGAGKTTLLVELARALVEQAEQGATQPLPILLPLSSWAIHKDPLHKWLAEEIARLYDLSPRLSQQWLQAEQVLPLLDGLDEMEEDARPACIIAINTYHRDHVRPLVICSRTSEYETATRHERLALQTAVVVQPLEPKQVNAYLMSLGKPLAGLRAALKTNALLQELATSPLLLQILMLTYHGTSIRVLAQQEASMREQVWTDYVQRMVWDKGDVKRYPLSVTIGWLRWLAAEMRQHNQAIFSLETLQPDWLPVSRRKWYRWSVGLVGGLACGPLGGLFVGLLFGLVSGLAFGLFVGLLVEKDAKVKPAERLTWSWEKFWPGPLSGLLVGLAFGLVSGLVFGLFFGLFFGLAFGLLRGFSGEQLTERLMLSPNEGIHRSLKNGLLSGLVFGLFSGLFFGLFGWLVGGLLFWLVFGLAFGLFVGLVGGLLFGLNAAIRHYLLRFWLAHSGIFSWRAVLFLEDATARILLRRVGGGYSFAHRLLLDYFADLDAQTPLAQGMVRTKSTSVQTKVSTSADEI